MLSDKALYWMAVGFLALVAGNSVVSSHGDWVSCLGEQSLQVAQGVTDRAMMAVSRAGTVYDQKNSSFPQGELAAMRMQTRLASIQGRLASRQARLQAEKIRLITLTNLKEGVICSRPEIRADVSDADENAIQDVN